MAIPHLRFGGYMAATSGGTNAAASSSYGSTSNQGGGPAGMTFQEAASVQTPGGGIMSQQQAQQAQQAINQQASQSGQGSTTETAAQIRAREEEESLAAKGKDIAQGIMTTLMGGGEGGNLDLTKEEAYANLPAGMHPLRKQYEYLKEKYGPNWANTTQAKVLEGYLSGVPVERGGGLGARSDETDAELIGSTNVDDIPMYDPVTGKYRSLEERQALADAAQARLNALNQFGGIGSLDAAEGATSTEAFLRSLDPEQLRLGLSPDQYFRFRQQLMAADPTPENQLYKSTFPNFGNFLGGVFEKFAPLPLKAAAGMLPERDLTGYQQNIDPISVGFEPLPVERDNQTAPIRQPGFMPIIPLPDPSQPEKPRYPLPGDPRRPPFIPGTGIETVFNPMFLGPSFRGSPYTNQGVSPAFYENLSKYY